MCHRNSGLVIAARAGHRPRRPAGRRDHRPAAAQPDQLLAAGRPRLRAGQAHLHAPLARRARRQDAVGRRLEAALRLRLRRRRDRGGARVARPDRRLHAGQADRARPRRGRVPGADLPQPLRRHEAGPGALRRSSAATTARSSTTAPSPACRETEYYVTTTSSGAGGMEQWFTWWNAVWNMDVQIVNVTSRDRRVQPGRAERPHRAGHAHRLRPLQRGLPLPGRRPRRPSPASPAWSCGSASSASSATRSTIPPPPASTCGSTLMEAGDEFSVKPFGLEPQRVLRLEKMHVIVGQDTNAESSPLEAGDALDREARQGVTTGSAATRSSGTSAAATGFALVGFAGDNGKVPDRGHAGGRAPTASRPGASPARASRKRLGKAIGIAWVPVDLAAQEGTAITHLRSLRRQDPGHRHPPGLLRPRRREAALVSSHRPVRIPVAGAAARDVGAAHADGAGPYRRRRGTRPTTTAGGSPAIRPAEAAELWTAPTSRTSASSTCAAPPRSSTALTGGLEPRPRPRRRRRVDAAADRRPTDTCSARSTAWRSCATRIGSGRASTSPAPRRRSRSAASSGARCSCARPRSDVRAARFPAGACMAGSVMRCRRSILNAGDRLVMLCGWEFGEYFWEALLDAGADARHRAGHRAAGASRQQRGAAA